MFIIIIIIEHSSYHHRGHPLLLDILLEIFEKALASSGALCGDNLAIRLEEHKRGDAADIKQGGEVRLELALVIVKGHELVARGGGHGGKVFVEALPVFVRGDQDDLKPFPRYLELLVALDELGCEAAAIRAPMSAVCMRERE